MPIEREIRHAETNELILELPSDRTDYPFCRTFTLLNPPHIIIVREVNKWMFGIKKRSVVAIERHIGDEDYQRKNEESVQHLQRIFNYLYTITRIFSQRATDLYRLMGDVDRSVTTYTVSDTQRSEIQKAINMHLALVKVEMLDGQPFSDIYGRLERVGTTFEFLYIALAQYTLALRDILEELENKIKIYDYVLTFLNPSTELTTYELTHLDCVKAIRTAASYNQLFVFSFDVPVQGWYILYTPQVTKAGDKYLLSTSITCQLNSHRGSTLLGMLSSEYIKEIKHDVKSIIPPELMRNDVFASLEELGVSIDDVTILSTKMRSVSSLLESEFTKLVDVKVQVDITTAVERELESRKDDIGPRTFFSGRAGLFPGWAEHQVELVIDRIEDLLSKGSFTEHSIELEILLQAASNAARNTSRLDLPDQEPLE